MSLDFLQPVENDVLAPLKSVSPHCIGAQIALHTPQGLPNLNKVKLAIIGLRENRREVTRTQENFNLNRIRSAFYNLFPGNWDLSIADLGDIMPGNSVEDTEYAVQEVLSQLITQNIIPIILGGSQDLTYAQYRAYNHTEKMVNLVNVDARFDIGDTEAAITDSSYVGKMIVNKPYHLFNYANIGYQSYLNSPEEINLIEKLFFESYRLGEISADITLAEPVMRDADLVSVDYQAISSEISGSTIAQPNGFNGREICALARYAGISDKVSSFGLYNLQHLDINQKNPLLPGEILWYFIEGVNYRKNEQNILTTNQFLKYSVPLDDEVLIFYKSKRSDRWWVEIPTFVNNKSIKPTFLPCSHQDYLEACNQEIPERWYKARRKNEL